jgi:hypothetical protein
MKKYHHSISVCEATNAMRKYWRTGMSQYFIQPIR